MKRKDFVQEDRGWKLRIPWRGLGHYHKAAPHCVEPPCEYGGLIEDCPRTLREEREGIAGRAKEEEA